MVLVSYVNGFLPYFPWVHLLSTPLPHATALVQNKPSPSMFSPSDLPCKSCFLRKLFSWTFSQVHRTVLFFCFHLLPLKLQGGHGLGQGRKHKQSGGMAIQSNLAVETVIVNPSALQFLWDGGIKVLCSASVLFSTCFSRVDDRTLQWYPPKPSQDICEAKWLPQRGMCFLKSQCTCNTEGVGSSAAGGRDDTKAPTASFLQNVSGGLHHSDGVSPSIQCTPFCWVLW